MTTAQDTIYQCFVWYPYLREWHPASQMNTTRPEAEIAEAREREAGRRAFVAAIRPDGGAAVGHPMLTRDGGGEYGRADEANAKAQRPAVAGTLPPLVGLSDGGEA